MSTAEELSTEFNRRASGLWRIRLFFWLAAVVVFLVLLLIAPHANHPNFVRGLAVGWPVLMAFVSAWRIGRR
jgi:hypothetical protein